MSFKDFIGKSKIVWHVSPNNHIYKLRATGSHKGVQAFKQGKAGIYVAPTFADSVRWWVTYVAHTKHRGKDGNRAGKEIRYRTATFYEIRIPEKILNDAWFSTNWEPEFFVPEEYLDQLEIVSKKTMPDTDVLSLYSAEQKQSMKLIDNEYSRRRKKGIKTNAALKLYYQYKKHFSDLKLRKNQVPDTLASSYKELLNQLLKISREKEDYTARMSYIPNYKNKLSDDELNKTNSIKIQLDQLLRGMNYD